MNAGMNSGMIDQSMGPRQPSQNPMIRNPMNNSYPPGQMAPTMPNQVILAKYCPEKCQDKIVQT